MTAPPATRSTLLRAKSLLLLALVAGVLGWRLVAAAGAGLKEIRGAATSEHWRRSLAARPDRYRLTLGDEYGVYEALAALGPGMHGIMLYVDAREDREGAKVRMTLLENQLTELLFPARAVGIVGPVPEAALPRVRPAGMYLVNLTPQRPFPRFRAFDQLSEHAGFTVWKGR